MLKQTSLKHYSSFFLLFALMFVFLFFAAYKSEDRVSDLVVPVSSETTLRSSAVFVGETEVFVEVSDTSEKRARGLSGKESLEENEGMLFIFEESAAYSFWMKEMHFPIDIIWIDETFRVADVTQNATPESFPDTFSPGTPVRYVLEVSAGFVKKHNITKGRQVVFSLAEN
ncbi:MAG: DUF192 domain-containing protein [Patescibacteria group bacterium]|nr:DUF192 domain-containing protein [Patescibacteria group bacterium]